MARSDVLRDRSGLYSDGPTLEPVHADCPHRRGVCRLAECESGSAYAEEG
jgi:hypothetical protein